jgi:hypothetical protein
MQEKFKLLSILISAAITNVAYATAYQNHDMQTLQQQINQLQQQINNLTTHRSQAPAASNVVFLDGRNSSIKFEEMSSSNLPLSMLKLKSTYPTQSLVLGGFLEMETQYWWGSQFGSQTPPMVGNVVGPNSDYHYHSGSGITVSSANLDAMANLSQWAQAYAQFTASDTNSMQLESGFINIGDLAQSPFFLTVGKNRMRFGNFPGAPWAPSITQGIVRPGHVNTLTVGYNKDHLNINLAMYNVPKSSGQAFMGSAFYNNMIDQDWSYAINAGIVSNVRGLGNAIGSALTSGATDDGMLTTASTDAESTPGFNIESMILYPFVGHFS